MTKKKGANLVAYAMNSYKIPGIVIKDAKRDGDIIFGASALNKQLPGPYTRKTDDIDVLTSKSPRAKAQRMQRKLDREVARQDDFYAKRAQFRGTWKVRHEGPDGIRNTDDDRTIVDYGKKKRGMKTKRIGGVRYETLSSIAMGKRKTLRDPMSEFRFEKDREDLRRIRGARKLRRSLI